MWQLARRSGVPEASTIATGHGVYFTLMKTTTLASSAPEPQRVVPQPFRWDRAWVVLGSHHVEFLTREALRLGYRSPSPIVQRLIEDAMERERERDDADATLNADVACAVLR